MSSDMQAPMQRHGWGMSALYTLRPLSVCYLVVRLLQQATVSFLHKLACTYTCIPDNQELRFAPTVLLENTSKQPEP